MKRILAIFTTLLLAITLIACDKTPETNVKVTTSLFENDGTSLTVELEIEDPDNDLKGDITLEVRKSEDSTLVGRSIIKTKEALLDDETKESRFTGLSVGVKYYLEVSSTINEEPVKLLKQDFTSKLPDEVEIKTVEDFFNIRHKRNAKYTLMSDLDFEGYEEEISSNMISTFTGIFNGNGKTIKNYTLESSNINLGIFQQLSTNAEVFDLTIDKMTINHKGKATGSKRVGLLFGQNTTSTTKVSNITIKNSTINLEVNSESNFTEIGFLGGASIANIKDINIDNTNTINITQERIGQAKIGGLLGKVDHTSTTDVTIDNINVAGIINYEIKQTKDAGLRASSDSVNRFTANLGGVIGEAKNLKLTNAIIKTEINFNESEFVIAAINEDRKRDFYLNINVAGVFATSLNVKLDNVLYNGSINVEEVLLTSELEQEELDKMKYKYEISVNVAGLLNNTAIFNSSLVNVLRLGDNFNLSEQSEANLVYGLLFTYANSISYNKDNNRFGIMDLVDSEDKIRVFNNLTDLFAEGSWVLENNK